MRTQPLAFSKAHQFFLRNLRKGFTHLVAGAVVLCVAGKAYAVSFTETWDTNFSGSQTSVVRSLGGDSFTYAFTGDGDGGTVLHQTSFGEGNTDSINLASSSFNTGTTERLTITRSASADFVFTSIFVRNDGGGTVTVGGYLDNALVGSTQTVTVRNNATLNFSGITVDEVRVTSTDFFNVNLDSFTGDTSIGDSTAPVFENSTPSLSSTTLSGSTVSADLDEEGTVYYVVVADGAGAPSSTQVKAGQDSGGSAATASGDFTTSGTTGNEAFSGLSPSTAYDLYVVAEDDEGTPNVQASPTKVDFVTSSPDSDGSLTASATVTEPVGLDTTLDSVGEAADVFDFTVSDGGGGDGLAMSVSQVVINVTGTASDAQRDQITWRLNGPDASNVTGTYSAVADTITFSGLSISIADSASETYTVNAYYNDNSSLTEDLTIILSVDGDTDLTVSGAGTAMGSTSAVTNSTGTTVDVTATVLAFTTQPAGSVSGSNLTTQPVVTALDGFGNTDVDFTETVTLTEASLGTLSGSSVAAVSGVATFTAVNYTATADQQSFTLTANDQDGVGSNLGTVDSNSVTSDVVATQLVFSTQPVPTSITSAEATSFTTVPVVNAVDANDTLDSGYSTAIALSLTDPNDSVLDGTVNAMTGTGDTDGVGTTVTLTPSSGIATFTGLQLTYTAGGLTDDTALRATSGGLTAANSTTITAGTPPTVTDGNISISGASGTGGAFITGDTVTVTWNNTAGGDNNSGISAVTVDFSSFGGGAAVAASNSSETWTATYTVVAGAIDATNLNVSVTATGTGGNTTTADTTNATADNTAPTLTDGNISISGASGTGGAFKVGDTVTATWNNTAGGDNNSDTISATTANFSAFGGGAAVAASESAGTWTATYSIVAGAVDGTNLNVAFTVTDNAGNTTTTADTTNATVDNVAPTLTDGNISISGASGTGGAYIVGDTVTVTWNNTAGGDNNSDTISSVTADFSAFGGGAAVAASNSSETWTATYTVVAGAIDGTNLNIGLTATDNAGNTTTTADSSNATVDNIAPDVTDGNIAISGASGSGGAYVIGDTVTATWNNTAGGDNNSDTISSASVDFSAFGGGAAVAASESAGTWTATYTLVAGAVDASNINVSVTATDNAGNTNTTADTSNATVDNVSPSLSDGNISIAGASGSGGAYISGDTVSVTWNNTAGGENNSDSIASVTADFSAFGGGAAVAASESAGTWTATYTITSGAIDGSNLNVSLTATDNAGNTTTTADTTNASVDNGAPTVTDGNIAISGASGTGGTFVIGDTVTATWNNTAGGDNNSDAIASVSADLSAFGGGAAVAASESAGTWTATFTLVAGAVDGTNINLSITAVDNAGNSTTTADSSNATVDSVAPTLSDSNIAISGASGTGGAYITGDTVTVTWDNTASGDNNSDTISAMTADFSAFGGGAAVSGSESAGTWTASYTIASGAIDASNLNVSVTSEDDAGNNITTADTSNAVVDNVAPTVTDGNISISGASGTGGAYIVGDTVVASWDNSGSGENNSDTVAAVNVDFSNFGGGAAVAASESAGIWSASYTITAGAIDSTNINVSVAAADNAGNTAAATDTSNATLDNIAPNVSDGSISLSGATGTGGVFKSGDTVTVTWDDTAGGDNNGDTSSVSVDFSAFGGGSVVASNASSTWTASYALADGLNGSNVNPQVSVTDDAGNVSTTSDSSNAAVDTTAPSGQSVSFDDVVINNTESGGIAFTMASAEVGSAYSYTITSSGGGTPVTGSGTVASAGDQISSVDLSGLADGTLTVSLTLTDSVGNVATATTDGATLDTAAPTGQSVSFDDAALNASDAGSTSITVSGAEVGSDYSYSITSSGGGAAVSGSGSIASAPQTFSAIDVSGLSDGTLTVSLTLTDTSGNDASPVTAETSLDQTSPDVTLTTASSSVNSAFTVVIGFTESVSGFVVGDLGVSNGALSGFNDDGGGNFSVSVTPSGDGDVTITLAADVAADSVGNNNTAASDLVVSFDGTAPTLSSSTPVDDATNVAYNDNVQLSFSETVVAASGNISLYLAADDSLVEAVDMASDQITVNTSSVSVDWTDDLVPTQSYYVQVDASAIADSAGNNFAGIGDTSTLNFSVSNINPVATDDAASVNEDNSVAVDVLANDTDVDSAFNAASVTVGTAPSSGSTSVNTGTGVITYTPNADFNGSDSFTYTVEDVYSGLSNTATASITVTAVNDAPVAVADSATIAEDGFVSIDVAANDSDVDSGDGVDASTIAIVSGASNGSTSVVNGEILYTPNANFNGSDSFTYSIEDQNGATSNAANVLVNVTGVNDLPVVQADDVSVDEDDAVNIDVLANDSDIDGTIDATTVSVFSDAENGVTAVDALTGVVTYTPNADFNGADFFTYMVVDNDGGSSLGVVSITVNSVNDAPVAANDTAVLQEDTPHSINVLGNDSDVDGTLVPASVEVVSAAGQGSTSVNASTGVVAYTPGNNFNGEDSFTYRVQDDEGAWSDSATVTLTVESINDLPVISGTPNVAVDEDSEYRFTPTASDVDTTDNLTFSVENLPAWASFDPDTGTISGVPDNSAVATYNDIVISVNDGTETVSLGSFSITVNNTNDTPQGSADSYTLAEGGSLQVSAVEGVLANDQDVDGDSLTVQVITGPSYASQFTLNGDGSFSYVHDGDEVTTDSFTYQATDGIATSATVTVNLSVTAVNDAPVFVGEPPVSVLEGQFYSHSFGVSDPDSVVTLTLVEGPSWLTLDGVDLSGTAPLNEIGAVPVVVRVSDGEYTVDSNFDLAVLEQENPLVSISSTWQGLPSIVSNTVDLIITLATKGPQIASGTLQVTLDDVTNTASMVGCTSSDSGFSCPVNSIAGDSTRFRLRITPSEEGNLIVGFNLQDVNGESLTRAITDLSVSPKAVSQGNIAFSLAKATALATINLQDDGTKELVAGTSLGETVKLLDYQVNTAAASVIGEIENRGDTSKIIVGDADLDGLDDIVVINRSGDASAVYYDRGEAFEEEPGSQVLPQAKDGFLKDLNDDDFPELIVGGSGFNLYVYENNAGVFDIAPLVFTAPSSVVHFAVLKRKPTDAPLEGSLAIGTKDAVMLVRFGLGVGTSKPGETEGGLQQKITLLQQLPLVGVSSIELFDVDGDGQEEIIASTAHSNFSATSSGVSVIRIGESNELQTVARLGAASAKNVDVADFNGDGQTDLLVANDNDSYQIYHGENDPSTWNLSDTIVYQSSSLVIPDDANGDGLADVLVYQDNDEKVELYLSATQGELGEGTDLSISGTAESSSKNRIHIAYALQVQNSGAEDVENVRISIPLPSNVGVLALPDDCTEDSEVREVNCQAGSLVASASWQVNMTLASDYAVNSTSITATVTSDALEDDESNNQVTTALEGIFQYQRVRIKRGGSMDWMTYMLLALLVGPLLGTRPRLSGLRPRLLKRRIWAMSCFLMSPLITQAEGTPLNIYGEMSFMAVSGDWDVIDFYGESSANSQGSVLYQKKDTRFGYQFLVGYQYTPNFAVEGGYIDSGETDLVVDVFYSDQDAVQEVLQKHAPVSGDGPYVGVRFSWYGEKQEEVYVKLGAWSWSAHYDIDIGDHIANFERDGVDWLIGGGFSVPVTNAFKFGGHAKTAVLEDERLLMFGFDFQYRFEL